MAKGQRSWSQRNRGDVELDVAHRSEPYRAIHYPPAVTLRDLHADWSWVVVLSNAAVGVWAIGAHWLAPLRLRALWWFVVAAEVAIFVQVGLGVALMTLQDVQPPQFHTFYGFVTLVFVAIFFAYRNQLRANLYLLYGLGSLFLMGMGIRSMVLA